MDRIPDPSHFSPLTPPLGDCAFTVSIAGLTVRFEGLSEELLREGNEQYAVFLSHGQPDHTVTVRPGEARYLAPAEDKYLRLEECSYKEGRTLLSHNLAAFQDRAAGCGELRVSSPDRAGEVLGCLENYLRWIVADLALRRGGFVLHASGLVREGNAHLFFGPSGAGKSTVASLSPGLPLLSDDLVLLLKERDGWKAATTPFCGSIAQAAKERGVYPLAGLYRLVQWPQVELCPVSPALAVGMVLACCPFVQDAGIRRELLLPLVEDCTGAVPVYSLRFRKDPSFWDVIQQEVYRV